MYWVKTPQWLKWVPGFFWPQPKSPKGVFITFDDGPHPEITPTILNILHEHGAEATFFCLGENAEQYPQLMEGLRQSGQAIGNHNYRHYNGWETANVEYLTGAQEAQKLTSRLYRPPYGKVSPVQLFKLNSRGYKLVLWDIMPGDFEENISVELCLDRIKKHLKPGCIIVLHENEKSKEKLPDILNGTLALMKERNLVAEKIVA